MSKRPALEDAQARWKEAGAEEATPPKGIGFVKFETDDTYVEGTLLEVWRTPKTNRDVATLTWIDGNAPVYDKDEHEVTPMAGAAVYLGLSPVMLHNFFMTAKKGTTVGIHYKGKKPTDKGHEMKLFGIWPMPNGEEREDAADANTDRDDDSDKLPF